MLLDGVKNVRGFLSGVAPRSRLHGQSEEEDFGPVVRVGTLRDVRAVKEEKWLASRKRVFALRVLISSLLLATGALWCAWEFSRGGRIAMEPMEFHNSKFVPALRVLTPRPTLRGLDSPNSHRIPNQNKRSMVSTGTRTYGVLTELPILTKAELSNLIFYDQSPWETEIPVQFLINLNYWEKLAGSRVAFSKWIAFSTRTFSEFTLVEPVFPAKRTTMLGLPDASVGSYPASKFFDADLLRRGLGVRLFPASDYYQLASNAPIDLAIHFEHKNLEAFSDAYLREWSFRIPCQTVHAPDGKNGTVLRVMGRPVKELICLHPRIVTSSVSVNVFRRIVGGSETVLFLNFDNRLKTADSKKALPFLRWRREWHQAADLYVSKISRPFSAFHFRTGKFFHHHHESRILPCLSYILQALLKESKRRRLETIFASLDIFGQGESNTYSPQIRSLLSKVLQNQSVFYSGRPASQTSEQEAPPIILSTPGKALLDSLIMARADFWIGSGASSGYSRLSLEERSRINTNVHRNDTKQVFCDRDSDWTRMTRDRQE